MQLNRFLNILLSIGLKAFIIKHSINLIYGRINQSDHSINMIYGRINQSDHSINIIYGRINQSDHSVNMIAQSAWSHNQYDLR